MKSASGDKILFQTHATPAPIASMAGFQPFHTSTIVFNAMCLGLLPRNWLLVQARYSKVKTVR